MKSKHFKLQELVSKEFYGQWGEKGWRFIDPQLILAIDYLKEKFPLGSMTINNWFWDGGYNESGLRTPDCEYYSPTSMHTFGKAADIKFSEYSTESVRQYILSNPDEFPWIRGIELGVSWLHIDVRNEDALQAFYP